MGINCGIRREHHVEILIREVFEKATTQHHFVGMYAELCSRLHGWFVENQVCGTNCKQFKRILLNRCQRSFEETLSPAEKKGDADLHKMRMLGNVRLVGALLENGMLVARILLEVVGELLTDPTEVSLECLAVFLTAVGPFSDRPEWPFHSDLEAFFVQVKMHSRDATIPSRTRFLLQDVLDLRASNWQNRKKAVRTSDVPTTLQAVHRRAEEERTGL